MALDEALELGHVVVGEPGRRSGGRRVEPGPPGQRVGRLLCAGGGGVGAGELGGEVADALRQRLDLLVEGGEGVEVDLAGVVGVGHDGGHLLAQGLEAGGEDCRLGVVLGGGADELVTVGRERVHLGAQGVDACLAGGKERCVGTRTIQARERGLLLDQQLLDGVARLGEGGGELGLEAAHLLGVGLDDDLEVVDLAPGLALGCLVRSTGGGGGQGRVVGRAAHRAAGADCQLAGDLGSHAVEPLLTDLDEGLAGEESGLGGLGEGELSRGELGADRLRRASGAHADAEHLEVAGEGLGHDQRLLGGGQRLERLLERGGHLVSTLLELSEPGRGVLTHPLHPGQLPCDVHGLALEGTHAGDVGEGPGRRTPVVRDLLVVEGLLLQQLAQASTRRSSLLLEVVDVAACLDREVVEGTDRTGALCLVDASLAARMLRCGRLDGGVRAAGGGIGRAESRQLDAGRGRLGRGHLLGGGVLDGDRLLHRCGDRVLAQLPYPCLERGGIRRPFGGRLVVGDLADPADEVRDRAVVRVAGAAQLDAPIAQPALGAVETAGLEHLLEEGVALLRARPEEGLEPSLRQQCDLAELGERHPHQPGHEVPGLVEAGAERVPFIGAVVASPGAPR